MLNKDRDTCAIIVDGPFAKDQTVDDQCWHVKENLVSIVKLDSHRAVINSSYIIESQVDVDLHCSVHPEAPSNIVNGSDRRMVADLLKKDRTPSYFSLIGLTKNRIEGLLRA